ncbi:MAG: RDD family protein [Rickettsiales bacterium]|nr:RDD family protein [Rickettsiales bacterium]
MNIAIKSETDLGTSQPQISSRRRRLCAYLFDYIILTLCMHIFSSTFHIFSNRYTYGFSAIGIISSICYFSIFPLSIWWSTPGQRLMGIYICTTKNNSQISIFKSISRTIIFHLLWVISFIISAYIFIGHDIKNLENILLKGSQQKKSVNFKSNMFYKDNPYFISFYNEKNNQKIHLLNVVGQSNIIIEDSAHKLSLSSNGKIIHSEYYDDQIAEYTEPKNDPSLLITDQQKENSNTAIEHLFFVFIKIIGYSIIIFLAILIFPTMFNRRKQTIYDLTFGVFVAKGVK